MGHFYHFPMDQWVGLGQLGITPASFPEFLELLERILPFVPEKRLLESRIPFRDLSG
jgi:hypothetical protein